MKPEHDSKSALSRIAFNERHENATSSRNDGLIRPIVDKIERMGPCFIPAEWRDPCHDMYKSLQQHLYRISDFIMEGQGKWFKVNSRGSIKFFFMMPALLSIVQPSPKPL